MELARAAGDADDADAYAITGLNCSCVHALVSARDVTLREVAALMAGAYAETVDGLLERTTQVTTASIKWKDTLQQRQQQKK